MQDDYDAVLIGAGHNSLACAAHLVAKGWRVGVFEQAAVAGGAIKTLELTAPGFRHDWAAMNLNLFAGSAFCKTYGERLQQYGLAYAPATHCFASVFEDGKWFGVSTDVGDTVARLEALSPADAKTWRSLLAEFPGEAEHVFALLGNSMKMHVLLRFAIRILMRRGMSRTAALARLLVSSPRAWLSENFESEHVRATLGAWGMHLDFAPDVAGGAVFPWLEAMANQSFGMVIGKGGADTVVRAMCAMIEAGGGQIHCNARVRRVLREGGKATGVELENGRRIGARKCVIANSAPGNLVDGLLDGNSGDAGFDRAMRGFAHAPGTMMIHLALNALPDWTASADLKKFAYVHIAPSLDQMARAYAQAVAGLLPDEPVIVVGQPTAIDPTRAPDGKHVLWVQVRMAPAEIRGDAAGEITERDWAAVKERFADRAIALIERHAPGLRDRIIARAVVSPLDLEADNPNLVGGDQICGSHHLSQHFMFRPAFGRASGSTPLTGLHLTGAAVWPGAGLGAGSGYLLGRQLAG